MFFISIQLSFRQAPCLGQSKHSVRLERYTLRVFQTHSQDSTTSLWNFLTSQIMLQERALLGNLRFVLSPSRFPKEYQTLSLLEIREKAHLPPLIQSIGITRIWCSLPSVSVKAAIWAADKMSGCGVRSWRRWDKQRRFQKNKNKIKTSLLRGFKGSRHIHEQLFKRAQSFPVLFWVQSEVQKGSDGWLGSCWSLKKKKKKLLVPSDAFCRRSRC